MIIFLTINNSCKFFFGRINEGEKLVKNTDLINIFKLTFIFY